MKATTRKNVVEALRKGSLDQRVSKEARKEAERQMRNQMALLERELKN